jgi:hypothetical protein
MPSLFTVLERSRFSPSLLAVPPGLTPAICDTARRVLSFIAAPPTLHGF